MKTSLLRRMLWSQALALGVLFLIAVAFNLVQAYRGKDWEFDDSLKMTSNALVIFLQDERDPARIQLFAERIRGLDETYTELGASVLKPGEYKALYQVFDSQGRMLYRTPTAPQTPFTLAGPGFHRVDLEGKPWRVLVQEAHGLRVLSAESLLLRRKMVWRAQRGQPIAFAIFYVVIALSTWLLSRRVLRPLKVLAQQVESRPTGDLSPLQPTVDLKETRPLVQAINGLLARVGELLESQRRFTADAAHELRTPLAVLGTQAHALAHATEEERQPLSEALEKGVERASSVVEKLLSVARMDGVEPRLQIQMTNLEALAQDHLNRALGRALAKGQDLGMCVTPGLHGQVDAGILGIAIDNLLENAIRHCPEGATLTLRMEEREGSLWVEMEDDGPGMSEAFKPHAFERFSRAPGVTSSGSGLGLSIVQRVAELHGGSAGIRTPEGGKGLCVFLRLDAVRG